MRSQSIATRSIRRARREVRPPSRITGADEAGIQIFVFRADRFLGSLMFDGAEPIVVGRHKGAGVRLDGEKISRRHCQLVLVDSQVFVEDLGSGNGTFINRERVYKREPVRATDGLCIGVYTLKVRTLRAAPLAPMDDAAADRTTKVDAILEADRTGGTDEVVVDLVSDELDNALYAEALRRQTGEERAKGTKSETRSCRPSSPLDDSPTEATANDDSVQVKPQVLPERTRRPRTQAVELPKHPATKAEAPKRTSTRAEAPKRARTHSGLPKGAGAMAKLSVEPHNIRPKSPLDQDSTMLAAKEVSLRPDSDSAGLDPEVEARLRDLDDLIASLDARYGNERQASSVPWRQDGYQSKATPAPSAAVPRSSIVEDSSLPGQPKMSTREFARDLASRLALDGAVIVTPTPKIIEEDPTEAADANDPLAIEAARLAAQNADDDQPRTAKADEQELAAITAAKALDDGPETELMDREIPILMEPRLPSIVARTRAPIVDRERPPIHTNPPTPAPSPSEPPKKMVHEARLLTPTPGEHPALNLDGSMAGESSFYDDVWTNSSDREDLVKSKPYPKVLVEGASPNAQRGPRISKHAPSSPPPLPKSSRPARRASPVVRPKSRIDDFDPSQPAPRSAFDGVEISARTKSRLVDIAVLRKGNEQYILGHRTPQGAVAPGRAHLGLRLLRINPDRTVDLVFPQDAGGHLMRGKVTVMFNELSEGRRYSCLRLEPTDIATVILGEGKNAITYHIRFLRRPKSLFSSLRRSHTEAARST